MKKATYIYKVNGIEHVYCKSCLPDAAWRLEMFKSGMMTPLNYSNKPCETCGSKP